MSLRRNLLLTAASLCVALLVTQAGAAPQPPRVEHEPPSNETVLVRLPDDSIRLFYVVQPARDEIRSLESRDHGRTWGNDRLEVKLPGKAYYALQVLLDRDQELQLVFHILGEGTNGYRGRHYNLWHAKTTGGRKAWTAPKQFFEGYVGSLRGFTQMTSGRLLLAAAIAVPEREPAPKDASKPDYGWNDNVVFYSDDAGDTWTLGPARLRVAMDPSRGRTRYGGVEPNLIQMKDGRVWMLIRTKNGHFYESFSSDGIAWPEPKPSRLISSDSPAATLRLRDGRLVQFLNACQQWDDPRSYAIGGRDVLHAAISDDDGKTWRGFREVLRDPKGAGKGDRGTAYPWAVEAADGNVVLVSGQGEGRRAVVTFSPDWLTETRASDAFADGAAQWTMYEQTGAGVIDHPDRAGAEALAIRKPEDSKHAAAVWNFPAGHGGKLSLRLRLADGSRGAGLSLTDHYNVAADTLADKNAVYSIVVDAGTNGVNADAWVDLAIEWSPDGSAVLKAGGQEVRPLKAHRSTALGVNYLRLHSPAGETDPAGFIVDRVEVEIEPAGSATTPAQGHPRTQDVTGAGAMLRLDKVLGPMPSGAVMDVAADVGAFDAAWVTAPSVLYDGTTWRMWYSSFYTHGEGPGGIGLATSTDGIHWERENRGEPVLAPGPAGAFDAGQVMGPSVLFDGQTYRMWYTGDPGRKHEKSKIVYYQIGLATSADGVHWTRANGGEPVLAVGAGGSPDEVQAATPCVLREPDGTYRMWYAAWAPSTNHTICVARSPDGVRWERENAGQPITGLSPSIAYGQSVTRTNDGRYLTLYMALGATRGLYAATSRDGLRWQMLNGGQPVLMPSGSSGAFDRDIVGHPFLLPANDRLRVYYTGYQLEKGGPPNWRLRIGLAEGVVR